MAVNLPAPYTGPGQQIVNPNANLPISAAQPPMSAQSIMTPGGLRTTQSPIYGNGNNAPVQNIANNRPSSYASRLPRGASGANNANAQANQSNFGPVDTGVGAFQQFSDNSYNAAMRQMGPQMEQQQRQIQQQLVGQGLQPGTAAYNAEMDRMTRGQNDMLQSAAFGAQNAGLQAQNQYFNQESQNNQFGLAQNNQNYQQGFNYDQLNNQTGIAQIGANARMAAATASAGASMASARASSQASMYGADMRFQLGNNQLNENGRQFNATDAFRNQQLDSSNMWNAANAFNTFNNTNTNNFNAQQNANQNWFGNAQSQTGMSPGAQFTPVGGTAQNMMANGQAQANASSAMWGNIGQAAGAFAMASDATMKENIVHDGKENGIDMFKFNYKGSKARYRGVVAQLIAQSHPHAVIKSMGKLIVDMNQLPVKMELLHV